MTESNVMTLPNQFYLQCLFFYDVLQYVSSVYMQESPQVLSPWSESMTQLIKRLDQLNLDIEEALSAGSSPSDTPNTARRHTANDGAVLQVTLFFLLVKYNVNSLLINSFHAIDIHFHNLWENSSPPLTKFSGLYCYTVGCTSTHLLKEY